MISPSCPVSSERIPAVVPRIVAFCVSIIIGITVLSEFWPLLALLAYDFFIRAFVRNRQSAFTSFALFLVAKFKIKSTSIDKAPKVFAAKLGFLLVLFSICFLYFYPNSIELWLVYMLLFFNILEAFFGFCAGCYFYSIIKRLN